MSGLEGLDLSVLAQFRASDLLAIEADQTSSGVPLQVALASIDFDPRQPRRSFDQATIVELAESIRLHGVLEPVSLRRNPEAQGRFVVNRGERRVRAARLAGLECIAGFLDERADPFAQAAENLHREDMSPFDLAQFIAEREGEGHTRAEIARRLNKPRSFITQAASLIDPPVELKQAFDAGRLGSDIRALYQLAVAMKTQPLKCAALLASGSAITRASLDEMRSQAVQAAPRVALEQGPGGAKGQRPSTASGGRTVLVVEHGGRRGSLRLKAQDNDVAEIRFGDGTLDKVRLADLTLICWATEELP